MRSECRVRLGHCIVALCSPDCLSGWRGRIQSAQNMKLRNSGGKRGRKMRQKLRSQCRVLLVHCVVAIVFSPGCLCCAGVRGKQMQQSDIKRGSKIIQGEVGLMERNKLYSY